MPKGGPGLKKSEEHRRALSEAAKRRYASQEARDAHAERLREVYKTNDALKRCQSKEAKQKQSRTLKQLWQTDNYRTRILDSRQAPDVREKISAAAKSQWSNPDIRQKCLESIRKSRRRHMTDDAQVKLDDPQWLLEQNETKTLTMIAQELGCAQSLVSVQFQKFGLTPQHHQLSEGEDQICDYLTSLGIAHERRNRFLLEQKQNGKELDVYIADHQLAIEYHGTYHHSYGHDETPEQKYRHALKADLAYLRGIRLLQFWDYEWQERKSICQSIIHTCLSLNERMGARKCILVNVSSSEARAFLAANHLQGFCPSSIRLGLRRVSDNALVMLMTLGKSRYASSGFELLRLATLCGLTVVGGAERLWAEAKRRLPQGCTVRTYADRRLFTGGIYDRLGFHFIETLNPGYHYWKKNQTFNRLQFQKHLLSRKLESFDAAMTEAQNMFANGYRRFWDAGQHVYEQTI